MQPYTAFNEVSQTFPTPVTFCWLSLTSLKDKSCNWLVGMQSQRLLQLQGDPMQAQLCNGDNIATEFHADCAYSLWLAWAQVCDTTLNIPQLHYHSAKAPQKNILQYVCIKVVAVICMKVNTHKQVSGQVFWVDHQHIHCTDEGSKITVAWAMHMTWKAHCGWYGCFFVARQLAALTQLQVKCCCKAWRACQSSSHHAKTTCNLKWHALPLSWRQLLCRFCQLSLVSAP